MVIVCWSAKGGAGVSVFCAALTLELGSTAPHGALAVDMAGDLPAVFGVDQPAGPGLSEWLAVEPAPGRGALFALTTPIGGDAALVHRGATDLPAEASSSRWARLADALATTARPIVVDAGQHPPPDRLRSIADSSLLVIRPCYLSLRRAAPVADLATGIVVVSEPGRAFRERDIVAALGRPVVCSIPFDPAIARAVDAGLLLGRRPSTLARAVRNAA